MLSLSSDSEAEVAQPGSDRGREPPLKRMRLRSVAAAAAPEQVLIHLDLLKRFVAATGMPCLCGALCILPGQHTLSRRVRMYSRAGGQLAKVVFTLLALPFLSTL